MSMVALKNRWRGGQGTGESGMSPGAVVNVGANFGTLGSAPFWGKRTYTAQNRTPFTPNPHNPTYNLLGPATWHANVNRSEQQVRQTAQPTAPVTFPTQKQASLAK